MCYFITVAVDKNHEALLKATLGSSFRLSRSKNASIISNLQPNDAAFELTDGMCSCGLYASTDGGEDSAEKIRRKYSKPKYKKRGWTEVKIERAIADSLLKPKKEFSGLRPDLRSQLAGLASQTGRLALVVHYYSGAIDTEEVPTSQKNVVSCEELQTEDDTVAEDVLVEINPVKLW